MPTPVTLRCAELRCEIKPELGGCISGLWLGGIPVLRSTPAQDLHSVRQSASYPLVPFSNRVGNATLQWQGTDHPLEMSLSITNQSAVSAPVGLGWHPSFVKRDHAHVYCDATGRWELGSNKLPTHRSSTGLDSDCATLEVDHCFDGWSGVMQLHDSVLRMRVVCGLSRMAQTGDSAQDLGICMLQPGQTFSCSMRIEMERA